MMRGAFLWLRKYKGYLLGCVFALLLLYLGNSRQLSQTSRHGFLHSTGLLNTFLGFSGAENDTLPLKFDYEDELTEILTKRIAAYGSKAKNKTGPPCPEKGASPCIPSSCNASFASSPRERIRQILATRLPLPTSYKHIVTSLSSRIKSYKYVFVTGASSDHYHEMQKLVESLHKSVFPHLSNYTFIIFNIGMTAFQRYVTAKNCRCTVLDFPFFALPSFMQRLKCYTWKPIIVASLMDKGEFVVWVDASIRWNTATTTASLQALFKRSRERGALTNYNGGSIAVRTAVSMVRFYGDEPCQYDPYGEIASGLLVFYMDRFTKEVIIKSWLSCAFDQRCMCVENSGRLLSCATKGPRRYGTCHRFDQSPLGIMYTKLLMHHRGMIHMPGGYYTVKRGERSNWFKPYNETVVRRRRR